MRIGVVPARSGSKRIAGKNTRLFAGKPILARVVETALESDLFDRLVVSTEDADIAALARSAGAEVPFTRPAELADDHTGLLDVMHHATGWMSDEGLDVEYACCLLATAPFLQASTLAAALDELSQSDACYAFPVAPFSFPIQRAVRLLDSGRVEAIWPEHRNTRSQDLEPAYHDAGQFYWGRFDAFAGRLPIFADHSIGVPLPAHLVQDIDTEDDWQRAELMFAALTERRELSP